MHTSLADVLTNWAAEWTHTHDSAERARLMMELATDPQFVFVVGPRDAAAMFNRWAAQSNMDPRQRRLSFKP